MKRICEDFYQPGDKVIALIVSKPIVFHTPETYKELQEEQKEKITERTLAVKAYLAKGQPDVDVQWSEMEGDAREEILVAARDKGATLVAVGHKGRSDLKNAFMGSVALHVARHSSVPVLVTRKHVICEACDHSE
eukprot:CAMPEP_0174258362 /NCGR_PEP_ID=MMETSP0439-20130205/7363_1 /TAXON_ID=0 /ORGANISM="Stereomyxa ramosa, Strain Chinc5" /LENGTH=134 /DNA_ID=CAMNT_0015341837 /DNA_START=468 /DNA_END=872 /DNA_ORIENTATION=+